MDWGVSFRQLAIAALLGMFAYIATMERAEAVLIIETCSGDVSIEEISATECWNQVTGFPTGDAAQTELVNTAFGGDPFTLFAKSDVGGSGIVDSGQVNPGTFIIELSLLVGFDELALIFKTGCGQNDPCSAVFGIWDIALLDPTVILENDEYNGIFDLTSWGTNGLSQISLFVRGEGDPPPPCTVRCDPLPEPGTLALIGTGLAALGVATRRRRKIT